jgi:hypothetical protein
MSLLWGIVLGLWQSPIRDLGLLAFWRFFNFFGDPESCLNLCAFAALREIMSLSVIFCETVCKSGHLVDVAVATKANRLEVLMIRLIAFLYGLVATIFFCVFGLGLILHFRI